VRRLALPSLPLLGERHVDSIVSLSFQQEQQDKVTFDSIFSVLVNSLTCDGQ